LSGWSLGVQMRRPEGLRVLLSLEGGSEASFFESAEPLPADGRVLWLGEAPVDEDEEILPLLWTLWPAGAEWFGAELEATLRLDNRLDMEARLLVWSDRLWTLLRWSSEHELIAPREEESLRLASPALLELLPRALDADASRSGHAELFAEPFPDESPDESEGDDQQWAAWIARSEEEILGARGGLARLLGEGFEARDGQLDMALATRKCLEREEHLMVEAGTGIGKSLAYLVPALLHGARERERVVVSTHTKALQEQLMDSDLPLLRRLGYPGRFRLLLGRNNYLCRRQLRRALHWRPREREEALARFGLLHWAAQSREGRRAEVADHPWFEPYWRALFESIEPCSPHVCHPEPSCFVVRARRAAREAPVVVVNHALLMMDLKSAQTLMGPSKLLVVDEAHQLGEVALHAMSRRLTRERLEVYRNLLGDRRTPKGLREVCGRIRAAGQKLERPRAVSLGERLDRQSENLMGLFLRWFEAMEIYGRELLGQHASRPGPHRYHDAAEAFGGVRDHIDALLEASSVFDETLASTVAELGSLIEQGATLDEAHESLASLLEFHRDFDASMRFAIRSDDEDWVYWLDWRGDAGLGAIVAAPLTVEEPFSQLWDRHYNSVVLTSATLAVGEDFTPFAESVGMTLVSRYTESLLVPSPFDFERQALVLTAGDLPQPNAPEFAGRVAHMLHEIASHRETKILVLSTSYRFIDELVDSLQGHRNEFLDPERVHYELLAQAPGQPRAVLADRFRRAKAAVLLATGSFWEGIDFPGRELEVLVLPRLPFAVPTDPVVEGRVERARRLGKDPFEDVSLADAVLRLKQGVGRLLRSATDRGVVLLLDQRLMSKSYGVSFLKSLPKSCELVATLDEAPPRVLEFLQKDSRRGARAAGGGR